MHSSREALAYRPPKWLRPSAFVALALAVLIVAAGLISRGLQSHSLKAQTIADATPTVDVISPKAAPQNEGLTLPGQVDANYNAVIHARVSGYLNRWWVDIGAHVKKGQLLADIDTPELDQQLEQAKANLATAMANESLAKTTAERWTSLLARDAVSKQETDEKNGDYLAKAALVQASKADVDRLNALESFKRIVAPFDGVVTARNIDTGQLITEGGANELFRMQALQTLRVYANLPQIYSSNVKRGQKIGLTFAEHAGRTYEGTLVRTADAIDPASRTLLVEVDVDNRAGELLPGSLAEVHFKTPSAGPTFLIPAASMLFRREGLRVGTVVNGNVAHLTPVVIGEDDGVNVQIVSGLSANDQVIQAPPDSLIEGEKVTIVNPNTGKSEGAK